MIEGNDSSWADIVVQITVRLTPYFGVNNQHNAGQVRKNGTWKSHCKAKVWSKEGWNIMDADRSVWLMFAFFFVAVVCFNVFRYYAPRNLHNLYSNTNACRKKLRRQMLRFLYKANRLGALRLVQLQSFFCWGSIVWYQNFLCLQIRWIIIFILPLHSMSDWSNNARQESSRWLSTQTAVASGIWWTILPDHVALLHDANVLCFETQDVDSLRLLLYQYCSARHGE